MDIAAVSADLVIDPVKVDLPIITASEPTVIKGDETKTYDQWYVVEWKFSTNDPSQPHALTAVCRKMRVLKDGTKELSPFDESVILNVSDIIGDSAKIPELATALSSIWNVIIKVGQGKL